MNSEPMDKGGQLRVLTYWRMLELFSPQKVPAPRRLSDAKVVKWTPEEPLPWENPSPPPPLYGKPRVWQHRLYLGVYELTKTYEFLHRAFADDPETYEEPPGGRSACAYVVLDQDGRLRPASAVLSSAMWATGRINDPGTSDPGWSNGFEDAGDAFATRVVEYETSRTPEGESRSLPHDRTSVLALVRLAQKVAGVSELKALATSTVIIDSRAVRVDRPDESDTTDFLNSFFLEELSTVHSHVRAGHCGDALRQYLTIDNRRNEGRRGDIVTAPQDVDAGVSLDRLPLGRWPSNPGHPLALSQQFAVNQALRDLLVTPGLLGVNGPPGTGKTTMLRDIVAGNVVERACRLARLERPTDAFTGVTYQWKTRDNHTRAIPQLRPDLTGLEMVVASANNAAVENVTVELPSATAIDTCFSQDADYFGDIATAILKKGSRSEAPRAWGLVGARLGNKTNRNDFWSALWWDSKPPARAANDEHEPQVLGLRTLLEQWKDGVVRPVPWSHARADFHRAKKRVEDLIGSRQAALQRSQDLPRLFEQAAEEAALRVSLTEQLANAEERALGHRPVIQAAADAVDAAKARFDVSLAARPSAMETIFSFGRAAKRWRADLDTHQQVLDVCTRAHTHARAQQATLDMDCMRARRQVADADESIHNLNVRRARLEKECEEDRRRYGDAWPGVATGDAAQLRAPWLDPELDQARSELFLAALTLHRDFIANTAARMLAALRAVEDIVKGEHPRDLECKNIRAAWQLLFLVVPLVSTTFASFGRMFGNIGPEAIGWLLIDEAGQAAPQQAVGAIWRARRVIAVGDPLQLEPVVTIPDKAKNDIAMTYRVSETWIPPRASVQTLADRVSRFGTTLAQGEEDRWVGAPLRVHRRCDDPMFALCNEIAYGGIMVNGVHRSAPDPSNPTPFDDDPHHPGAPTSRWLDEAAPVAGSHLQAKEITRLRASLAHLNALGVPLCDIIAISPFKAVADELVRLKRDFPGLQAGTIHTAQGREADVVFLVLGGDPEKPGAKRWAASKVNLVNVAASRAKRRLYVIGDEAAWSKQDFYRQLSARLRPAHRLDEMPGSPFALGLGGGQRGAQGGKHPSRTAPAQGGGAVIPWQSPTP